MSKVFDFFIGFALIAIVIAVISQFVTIDYSAAFEGYKQIILNQVSF